MCAVQLCLCVYALRQASDCVKAGLGPAASQEDRRGSRWICLDLTLPTPLHPLGLAKPARLSAEQKEGSGVADCGCAWSSGGWDAH